MMPTFGR